MTSLRKLLPSANYLYVFEAAARLGSFSIAGNELGMSQVAVSYAIRKLEQQLGTQLFIRRPRGVELTEIGGRFYGDVALGLTHIRRSAEQLVARTQSPHVTISGSTAFASYWLLPRLADFNAQLSEIDLRVQTTNRDIDLGSEDIQLAVRWGDGDWTECDKISLNSPEVIAIASPDYIRRHGRPKDLTQLTGHRLIHLEEPHRKRPGWRDWFRQRGITYPQKHGLHLNDYALVLKAAVDGQGIAMGWRFFVDMLVRDGQLSQVITEGTQFDKDFYLIWPSGPALSDPAQQVRNWVLAQVALPGGITDVA